MNIQGKLSLNSLTSIAAWLAVYLVLMIPLNANSQESSSDESPKSWESKLSQSDRIVIAVQKICPVSGKDLGSMGAPVKVNLGGQHAFLCCKSCLGREVKAVHWKKILTNLASAQGTCPVMGKPVDGSMESTIVRGHRIFVCCPPCIEKIEKNVDAHIKKLNESYAMHLAKERAAKSDKLQIAAQRICPVSGKTLGSMEDPVKIKVGEKETAFLCCKGCLTKKIEASHWKAVLTNIATAQGICPVMKKPIDATMESTIVGGRRVFVCCPPCIKKIDAKPMEYMRLVNSQIENLMKDTKREE